MCILYTKNKAMSRVFTIFFDKICGIAIDMLQKTAILYKVNRQYIYRWRKRYGGTLQSRADKSHRPHRHPNEHTQPELKLITDLLELFILCFSDSPPLLIRGYVCIPLPSSLSPF